MFYMFWCILWLVLSFTHTPILTHTAHTQLNPLSNCPKHANSSHQEAWVSVDLVCTNHHTTVTCVHLCPAVYQCPVWPPPDKTVCHRLVRAWSETGSTEHHWLAPHTHSSACFILHWNSGPGLGVTELCSAPPVLISSIAVTICANILHTKWSSAPV